MSDIPLELREEIVQALRDGQTIVAIKLYREATGADLRDAKLFVEQLQAALKSGSAEDAAASGMSDEVLSQIVELLRRGAKIPAIKVYREAIPSSLKDAKEALIAAYDAFETYYKENPEATHANAVFGALDKEHWDLLNRKHFHHHYEQFGLL